MSKRNLKFKKKGHYHITNRGLQKKKIFYDHDDYMYFLEKVFEYKNKFSIELIFYCLMPNHFHLVVRQNGDQEAREFISMVQMTYAKYFNKKYGRKGQLFEGRYRCVEIKDQKHLINLINYLMQNPVKAGLVKRPEDWPYLSFNKTGIREIEEK